jgi:hypothetical protein
VSARLWSCPTRTGSRRTHGLHTDDPKGTLARVEKLGGKVIMPLIQVAPETTIALFADPEGHIVGLM